MDTKDLQRSPGSGGFDDAGYEEPGLGSWLRRNPWLLVRLFTVLVFTFSASSTAANFSYGLQGKPVELSVEQINAGQLPPGLELGDYVRVTGTPDVPSNLQQIGTPYSQIAVSARYSTAYFYFGLQETDGTLLVQSAQGLPEGLNNPESRVWEGKLSTVGQVIFHGTTQQGLEQAQLPQGERIPVIETGDTPTYYRQIFPAYSAIILLWLSSIGWLLWKKNKPFAGI